MGTRLQGAGTLRSDALYVERPADRDLFEYLIGGEFCFVLAPRQIGKSSLKDHTLRKLQKIGIKTINIDLTGVGAKSGHESFYGTLIDIVSETIGIDSSAQRERYEELGEKLSSVYKWTQFLRNKILTKVPEQIVIFIDEIDTLKGSDLKDDFLAAIRSIYNERGIYPAYQRLTFCILGVTTPNDLITDENRTPFNIGKAVVLEDFSRSDLNHFKRSALLSTRKNSDYILDRIFHWTSGHPYMTQQILVAIEKQMAASPVIDVEVLVHRLFLEPYPIQDANLAHAEKAFDRSNQDSRVARMLELYKEIYDGAMVISDRNSDIQSRLKLAGMAADRKNDSDVNYLSVRNLIYKTVFDEKWIKSHQENRLVSGALQAWLASGKDPADVLRGAQLEKARNWLNTANDATDLERIFIAQSIDVEKQEEKNRWSKLFFRMGLTVVIVLLIMAVALLRFFRQINNVKSELSAAQTNLAVTQQANKMLKQSTQELERQKQENIKYLAKQRQFLQQAEIQAALLQRTKDALSVQIAEAERAKQEAERERQKARLGTQIERGNQAIYLQEQPGQDMRALIASLQSLAPSLLQGTQPPAVALRSLFAGIASDFVWLPLRGHKGPLRMARFSPKGDVLVTWSTDGTARLWDAQSSALKQELRGHKDEVTTADFSSNGGYVATGSADGTVLVFETSTGKLAQQIEPKDGAITELRFAPAAPLLAIAAVNGAVQVWDAETQKLRWRQLGHTATTTHVVFSPDGSQLASASDDHTVKLWGVDSGKLLRTFSGHKHWLAGIAFSRSGKGLASASYDHTVRLWSVETGRTLRVLTAHTGPVISVQFASDSPRLITASLDGTARIWKLEPEITSHTLLGHSGPLTGASFSPNAKYLLTTSSDGTARLWDSSTEDLIGVLNGHSERLSGAHFSPDSERVVTASSDGTGRLWHLQSEKAPVVVLHGHQDRVSSVMFSATGERLLTSSDDGTVRLWNPKTGVTEQILESPHQDRLWIGKFSRDGAYAAAGGESSKILLWELQTKKLLHTYDAQKGEIWSLDFSPDLKHFVTSGSDATQLWQIDDAEHPASINSHETGSSSALFGTAGSIVTTSIDGSAKIWDINKLDKPHYVLTGHQQGIVVSALSPGGAMLLLGSKDHTATLWSMRTGDKLAHLLGHSDRISAVSFSQNGKCMTTGSFDRSAKVWDEHGKLLFTAEGHKGAVVAALLPAAMVKQQDASQSCGTSLVTVSTDGYVRIWDVSASGGLVATLGRYSYLLHAATLGPDGQHLAVAGEDGEVRVISLKLADWVRRSCAVLQYQPEFKATPDVAKLCRGYSVP